MRTTRVIVAAAAAVASGAAGAPRRPLARRVHQPQRQLGEQRAAEAVGAAQQILECGRGQHGQRPAHPSSAPWRVGGECLAGGGVMESGEPLRIEPALTLEGGELLPGLRLELAEIWSS